MDNKTQSISAKLLIKELKLLSDPSYIPTMSKFGINTKSCLGIKIPTLRGIAKRIGKNNELAASLWDLDIHEARILSIFIANPKTISQNTLYKWIGQIDSWDICDALCGSILWKYDKDFDLAIMLTKKEAQYQKRAGFSLIAYHSLNSPNISVEVFNRFIRAIESEADDERNFVKKSVNWALRQIGKRSLELNALALNCAKKLKESDSKSARWIGSDAYRELSSAAVVARLKKQCQ